MKASRPPLSLLPDPRALRFLEEHHALSARIRQQNEESKRRFRDALFRLPIYFAAGAALGQLLAWFAHAGHARAAWTAMLTLSYLALVYLLALGWRVRRRR